jgi:DNA-binding NarL/FixJ family response regulator
LALNAVEQMEVSLLDEATAEADMSARQHRLDLLLIDAALPEMRAFQLIQHLRTADNSTRTILLISSSAPDLLASCLQAGADGCVLDNDTLDDLRRGIESVLAGRSYCSPQVAERLFTQRSGPAQPSRLMTRVRECRLTHREIEILRLIAQRDLSNKQIARELRLSINTIKNHVHSIIEKLSVENRQTAVRHAVVSGLLRDPVA